MVEEGQNDMRAKGVEPTWEKHSLAAERPACHRRGVALAAVALTMLGACSPKSESGSKPNVLLITIDTLRADRLSCYGYTEQGTPNIDALAASGALFETAFCDVTWTTPSMSSVMTGTYATIHGFKSNNTQQLDERNITLAEVLRDNRYTTAAVVGSFPLDSIYQLDQGFQSYDDEFTMPFRKRESEPAITHVESEFFTDPKRHAAFVGRKLDNDAVRTDREVTEAALEWLRAERSTPFFLWVHYFGPHSRPDASLSFLQNSARHVRSYDSQILTTDREVGRLLAAFSDLGLDSDTMVVFHADHGEALGEHKYVGHGIDLYEPNLRIPLIIRFPRNIAAGVRVRGLARNVDIFATILDATGIETNLGLSGSSLLPAIRAAEEGRGIASLPERETYAETYEPAHPGFAPSVTLPDGSSRQVGVVRRAVRNTRWKLISTQPHPFLGGADRDYSDIPASVLQSLRTEELYDLASDPDELENVAGKYPAVVERLRARLERYIELEERGITAPAIDLDQESKERLRSLGY